MPYKFQKTKKGFTFVELIIVIAIMVIMTAVLLLNQNQGRPKTDVDNIARQIATELRSLQNDALNGKEIGSDVACRAIMNVASASSYETHYMANCGTTKNNFGSQNFNLKNVQISPVGGNILFKALGGTVDSSSINKILITSTKNNSVHSTVCINKDSGNIFEEEGNFSCP